MNNNWFSTGLFSTRIIFYKEKPTTGHVSFRIPPPVGLQKLEQMSEMCSKLHPDKLNLICRRLLEGSVYPTAPAEELAKF